MTIRLIVALMLVLLLGTEIALAMNSETAKVVLYRRGETIAGEEFLAANEAIVDYLATLKRPTEGFKGIPYQCQVKYRAIQPTVYGYNTTNPNSEWVTVAMVYELRDCKEMME